MKCPAAGPVLPAEGPLELVLKTAEAVPAGPAVGVLPALPTVPVVRAEQVHGEEGMGVVRVERRCQAPVAEAAWLA